MKTHSHSECANASFRMIRSFPRRVKEGLSHRESKHLNDPANPQLGTLPPSALPLLYFVSFSREIEKDTRGERERQREGEKKERDEGEERLRENFSASRSLRISFTVTDIRHGQRSSSSGRRNREMGEKRRGRNAQDEQKGS